MVCACDLVFDTTVPGQQINCLTVIDQVHPGAPGHRHRRLHSHPACAGPTVHARGQRARVFQSPHSQLDHNERHRHLIERPGTPWQNSVDELQRQTPRRVPVVKWLRSGHQAAVVICHRASTTKRRAAPQQLGGPAPARAQAAASSYPLESFFSELPGRNALTGQVY